MLSTMVPSRPVVAATAGVWKQAVDAIVAETGAATAEVQGRATGFASATAPVDPTGVSSQVDTARSAFDNPEAAGEGELKLIPNAQGEIAGAVLGRALYNGAIKPDEALKVAA